ncbi:MAG: sulfatase-like hydrolase/transferase [Verrucomicrobia bacterium]|nr:sulfatase-like hydrolase/transferase [Verrucomicrobiota bacterium]
MNAHFIWRTFRVLCPALALTLTALSASERPNFIIIFMDDVGYADVGCFGAKNFQTPRLDRFAGEGVRLTDFYAQAVCGPSRGALMTGRYPVRVGGGWRTNGDEVTVAEVLKGAGYVTCCIGKWDMSNRRYQEGLMPNDQGFEHYFGTWGANDSGKVTLHRDGEKLETTSDMSSLTRRYTDEAIKFLGEQKKEKPFFLYLAHTMAHVMIDASEQFKGKSGGDLYGDVMEEADGNAGRLLDAVRELGFEENTFVLFTSDNGPWNSKEEQFRKSHGGHQATGSALPLRGGKSSAYEGGFREPTILRGPGVPVGESRDGILATLDVLPTFAALAGADLPQDRVLDGVDQSAYLLGKAPESARDHFVYHIGPEPRALRWKEWKLWFNKRGKGNGGGQAAPYVAAELYNLKDDIGESKDVAADHPEIVARLLAMAQEAPSGKKPVPGVKPGRGKKSTLPTTP